MQQEDVQNLIESSLKKVIKSLTPSRWWQPALRLAGGMESAGQRRPRVEPHGAMQGFVEVRELVVPRSALSIRVEKSNRKLNKLCC